MTRPIAVASSPQRPYQRGHVAPVSAINRDAPTSRADAVIASTMLKWTLRRIACGVAWFTKTRVHSHTVGSTGASSNSRSRGIDPPRMPFCASRIM